MGGDPTGVAASQPSRGLDQFGFQQMALPAGQSPEALSPQPDLRFIDKVTPVTRSMPAGQEMNKEQTRNALDELNLLQGRTYPPPLSPVPPSPVTRPLTPGKPGPIFVPPNKQIGVPPRRPVMQPPVMPRPPNPRRGLRQTRAFASQARGRK